MPSVHRPIGFPIGRAQSMAGRQAEPAAAPRQPSLLSRCVPSIHRQALAVLPDCAALTSLTDSSIDAGGVSSPGRLRSLKRVISSPLSLSNRNSVPPEMHERPATALQRMSPGIKPASTWSTLPLYGVSSTWSTCSNEHQAPDTTPAAAEVPRLVMVFVLLVTSLAGVTRRIIVVCPRSRGGIVSRADRSDFEGQKPKAPLYPSAMMIRCSAPSPAILTGKPFRAFHG